MAKKLTTKKGTNRRDRIDGGNKSGRLIGLGGDDTLNGNGGDDILIGGSGDDTVSGGTGQDLIFGNSGDDTLNGDDGNDVIFAGSGDDTLNGGTGDDTLNGGSGNDRVEGGRGSDKMLGGTGDDVLIWRDGDGSDLISGGNDTDTVNVEGSLALGDNFALAAEGTKAIFDRLNLFPFKLTVDTVEQFLIEGEGGDDTLLVKDLAGTGVTGVTFLGGDGNDILEASESTIAITAEGGSGNDDLAGGFANDTLNGGDGDDQVEGEKGNDTMIGGAGNDTLAWDDGDGSDIISGNEGIDTVEVEGSLTQGDSFTLNQNGTQAIFDRVNLVPFKLTVDTVEVFEVEGVGGDDILDVNDLSNTTVTQVIFNGGNGNDTLDGSNTNTPLVANGDSGNDILIGGSASDLLAGGDGIDTLTGNGGADKFVYAGNPFANGVAAAAAGSPIKVLAAPDVITDFTIAEDQYVLDSSDLGIQAITFQNGKIADIKGNGNVIVLQDSFENVAAAAQAIAENNSVTAKEGVFVYFNSSLGFSRLVYSKDLGGGGDVSVLANMTNQSKEAGLANLASFTSNNFSLQA